MEYFEVSITEILNTITSWMQMFVFQGIKSILYLKRKICRQLEYLSCYEVDGVIAFGTKLRGQVS